MTELIGVLWMLSLIAAGYGGYRYGKPVASKLEDEQAKIKKAAKDIQ